MTELRVITEDLPNYKFPFSNVTPDCVFGYTMIQARNEERFWEPRWCLIDPDGTPLAIFEADSFEDLSPEAVSQAASDFIMNLHGLGEEDTGYRSGVFQSDTNQTDSYTFIIT